MKPIRKLTKILLDLGFFISVFLFTYFYTIGNKPLTIGSLMVWAVLYFTIQHFNIIYYREVFEEVKGEKI